MYPEQNCSWCQFTTSKKSNGIEKTASPGGLSRCHSYKLDTDFHKCSFFGYAVSLSTLWVHTMHHSLVHGPGEISYANRATLIHIYIIVITGLS